MPSAKKNEEMAETETGLSNATRRQGGAGTRLVAINAAQARFGLFSQGNSSKNTSSQLSPLPDDTEPMSLGIGRLALLGSERAPFDHSFWRMILSNLACIEIEAGPKT